MKSSSALVSPWNMQPRTSPNPTLHGEYLSLSLHTQNPWQFPEELWLCKPNRAWLIFWIIKIVLVCMDNISFWAKLANTEKNLYAWIRPQFTAASWLSGVVSSASFNLVARVFQGLGRPISIHRLQYTCRNWGWTFLCHFTDLSDNLSSLALSGGLRRACANNGKAGQPPTHIFTTSIFLGDFHAWQSFCRPKSSEITGRPPEPISNKMDPAFRSKAPCLDLWVALGF